MSAVLHALRTPVEALLDPGKRVFLPFLAGAALLAALALPAQEKQHGRGLFSREVWLHPSARVDYQFLLVKALLRLLFVGPLLISTFALTALTASWLRRHLGHAPLAATPALVAGAVFTLVAFVVEDYSRYLIHKWMHRVPALWAFHQVHHSAEVLTPLTLYRTHPVEAVLNGLRSTVVLGLCGGACIWLFGSAVEGWAILGVDGIGFVWSLAGANLRHSHVWLSYGPRVERILMSPAQHQVHHSAAPEHVDRNFGTVLALWDWLAGSLYVTREREALRYGLPGPTAAWQRTTLGLLVAPLPGLWAQLTARPPRLLATRALLATGALLLIPGCSSSHLDRAALLQSLGQCTVASYDQFVVVADALVTATQAEATAPTPANRDAARDAWRAAIDAWQEADVLRYGPLAAPPNAGGQDLRPQIYSWPGVDRCLIEQQLVEKAYEGAAFASASSSARGLGALEYLLFYEGVDNACEASVGINAQGTWLALDATTLSARKAAYASAAAKDVAARARAVVAAWRPNGFLEQLTTAGNGSTLFPTQQAALSAVVEGMLTLDTEVKDAKLGAPLGLLTCDPAPCAPQTPESPWAGRGKSHLAHNLDGFDRLFTGCGPAATALGFQDLLVSAGVRPIADEMRDGLIAARTAVAALPDTSLVETLTTTPQAMKAAYDAMKAVTDTLKHDLVPALQITTTNRVEGDHD